MAGSIVLTTSGGNYSPLSADITAGVLTVAGQTITAAVAGDSAVITWTAPTLLEDGSAISGLDGFRIWYGTDSGAVSDPTVLTTYTDITDAGQTEYTFSGLASGTWYFAIDAYTTGGAYSARTYLGSKVIA